MYSIIAQGQTSVLRKANFMKWINVICALILFALPVQAATVRYQHTDMLGSVVSESDESGNIISRSQYEPFGKRMGGDKEGIGYTGHLQDKDLGLTYMQARYYDPLIGRFYTNDPMGFKDIHNFNRYAYGNNNPYRYTDPDGKFALPLLAPPVLAAIGKAAAFVGSAAAAAWAGSEAINAYNESSDAAGDSITDRSGQSGTSEEVQGFKDDLDGVSSPQSDNPKIRVLNPGIKVKDVMDKAPGIKGENGRKQTENGNIGTHGSYSTQDKNGKNAETISVKEGNNVRKYRESTD